MQITFFCYNKMYSSGSNKEQNVVSCMYGMYVCGYVFMYVYVYIVRK